MSRGRCLCGAIEYEYSGEPILVVHCHCESCRRQTASMVATFVIVPKTRFALRVGNRKSSPRRPACGAASAAPVVLPSIIGPTSGLMRSTYLPERWMIRLH